VSKAKKKKKKGVRLGHIPSERKAEYRGKRRAVHAKELKENACQRKLGVTSGVAFFRKLGPLNGGLAGGGMQNRGGKKRARGFYTVSIGGVRRQC